jgi:uncharacterized phage protein (TIGR02218 family)
MKSCSSALAAHLAGGQTTTAVCLLITRTDGAVLGLTELDQDIVFNGVTYLSGSGFSRFNLQSKQNLEDTSIQLDGMLDNVITRDDAIGRRYDYADVEVFLVNWANLSEGKLILHTGNFGPLTIKEYSFSVELYGMSHRTIRTGGELCSPNCRVDLGSVRCGINLPSFQQSGTVTSTDGFKTLTVSGVSGLPGAFDSGTIVWTSGNNVNLSAEVSSQVGGNVTLKLDALLDINPGDTFSIQPGCDKTFFTCVNVFANGINFQGEPHVPGYDHLLDYPDYHPPHK